MEETTLSPYDESIEWIKKTWTFFSKNPFKISLLTYGFLFVITPIQFLPFFGSALSAFLSVFLMSGIYMVLRDLDNQKEIALDRLFWAFNHRDFFRRMLPLALINLVVTSLASELIIRGGGVLTSIAFVMTSVFAILLYLILPLMVFRSIYLRPSWRLVRKKIHEKWKSILIFGCILFLGFVVGSMLILPILILIPIAYCAPIVLHDNIWGSMPEKPAGKQLNLFEEEST